MTLAGFPAQSEFRRDNRRPLGVIRVYDDCVNELDFVEVREVKILAASERLEMAREDVSVALTRLVDWGYLIEHERGARSERRFTLAWSVQASRRPHVG